VDGARGGEEGERGGDHLVARLEVEGSQRKEERIGAAGAAHGVPALGELRDLGLELPHLRTHDEALARDDGLDRAVHVVLDRAVLRHQVQQGYVHGVLIRCSAGPGGRPLM
jgi:hypothetical protein